MAEKKTNPFEKLSKTAATTKDKPAADEKSTTSEKAAPKKDMSAVKANVKASRKEEDAPAVLEDDTEELDEEVDTEEVDSEDTDDVDEDDVPVVDPDEEIVTKRPAEEQKPLTKREAREAAEYDEAELKQRQSAAETAARSESKSTAVEGSEDGLVEAEGKGKNRKTRRTAAQVEAEAAEREARLQEQIDMLSQKLDSKADTVDISVVKDRVVLEDGKGGNVRVVGNGRTLANDDWRATVDGLRLLLGRSSTQSTQQFQLPISLIPSLAELLSNISEITES